MHTSMIFKFKIATKPSIKAAIATTMVIAITQVSTNCKKTLLGIFIIFTTALVAYALGISCTPPLWATISLKTKTIRPA